MGGLPASTEAVCVGPPLFASDPTSPPPHVASSVTGAGLAKHDPSVDTLEPSSVGALPTQLAAGRLPRRSAARVEEPAVSMPPPAPREPAAPPTPGLPGLTADPPAPAL